MGALDKVGVTVVPYNTEGLLEVDGILDTVGIRVPFNAIEVGALDEVGDLVTLAVEGCETSMSINICERCRRIIIIF